MKVARPPGRWTRTKAASASKLNALLDMCLENRLEVQRPLKILSTSIQNGTLIGIDQNASNYLFPVTLTQTGGSTGDLTNYCSYTYTVTSLTGAALTTAAAPLNSRARIAKGPCTAATKGSAYLSTAGALVLWDADEVHGTGVC